MIRQISLPRIGTVAAWRRAARQLAGAAIPPEEILWQVEGAGDAPARDLFAAAEGAPDAQVAALRLPREALVSIETALCHTDPQRFGRAYDIVLRLSHRTLRWGDRADTAMYRLLIQEKAVRRDIHKMHAFVRFREVGAPDAARRAFAAWFEPEHYITEIAAPFFARRFGDMDWLIMTPQLSAIFEDGCLRFDLARPDQRPPPDANEDLWRTYYASICNPARLSVSAMTSQMPRKYWKNLPEAQLIPDLIRSACERAEAMRLAAPTLPPMRAQRIADRRAAVAPHEAIDTLAALKPALDRCRRCPLGTCATQGVAGEGPGEASLMLVGEQPGDTEDIQGKPFVGPAGQVLDECLRDAKLDRRALYATNAVKHFKFQPRGKRRLHQRPLGAEIDQCKWWLEIEKQLLNPALIVALGATAARALTGNGDSLLARRGNIESDSQGRPVLITLHPSAILRTPDPQKRAQARAMLVQDLTLARKICFPDRAD